MSSTKREAEGQPSGEPPAKRQKVDHGSPFPEVEEPEPASQSTSMDLDGTPIVDGCGCTGPCTHGGVAGTLNVVDGESDHDSDPDGVAIEWVNEDEVDEMEEPLELISLGSCKRAASLYPA
ncbi:hypothetical protein FRB94_014729 [Tulasnella sp. JGI-2019a]|nr:hypothetical protein FRB94_014729 [Tulasnella sp. JGI-2019a]KAG9033460.1 hypothetical protein FRB95_014739 [Tulasnella sp. JGI-2019a]